MREPRRVIPRYGPQPAHGNQFARLYYRGIPVDDGMIKRTPLHCTPERWATAQVGELGFWGRVAETDRYVEDVKWPWYQRKAARITRLLLEQGTGAPPISEGVLVEVGAGPVGVAPLLSDGVVVLLDPLAREYAAIPAYAPFRASHARYVAACGEAIPVGTGAAALLIAENCLDHVRDMETVLSEMHRVLRPGGLLYLTVNCRSRLGRVVHGALARVGVDPGHPHSVIQQDVLALLEGAGFTERWRESESLRGMWWNDLIHEGIRGKMKAALGVSEALLECLFERTP